ncbi:MAG TPA: vitamin K epoxide reductase family protein [Chitinophagaceae bacterium]|nr:vitamin K epoxide reductase family protein [Chitinophagaceae bacterium]
MKKDNATVVLTRLIEELDIPVTRQTINEQLLIHPDYGSLLAFGDILNDWHVPNIAYSLTFDQLDSAPVPFIAYIYKKEFAVITKFDESQVVMTNEKFKNRMMPKDEFKLAYSGAVFMAEKEPSSGEKEYKKNYRKELVNNLRLPMFLLGAFAIFFYYVFSHTTYLSALNVNVVVITFLKTLGLVTSIILLTQSIDSANPLIQKLCGADNYKGCNSILSSKASKITEELNWSEVGFFYFAGTWLSILFYSDNISNLQLIALLNLLSLPYTFYSVYYQKFILRQWCKLCLTVQVLLWIEFLAFLPYLLQPLRLSLYSGVNLFALMSIPFLIWIIIKPYLQQSQQLLPLKKQLSRFKYNKDLFNKLLNEEVKYSMPSKENSLIIGNINATNTITLVSSLHCQPCADVHNELDEWISDRDDVNLQIIFFSSQSQVSSHLLNLQYNKGAEVARIALKDWYDQKVKDYETWSKKHMNQINDNEYIHKALNAQLEWCKIAEIAGTPTLFLNGRKLPKTYHHNDLKYLI